MKKTRRENWSFSLYVLLFMLTLFLSCGKGDNNLFPSNINDEITILPNTNDTIVYVTVDNIKIPVYLSIPEGCNKSNYPAVVVLHGSDGMWKNHNPEGEVMSGQNNEWKEIFNKNCIISAFVDSYSSRGVTTRTGKWTTAPDNFKISSQFIRPRDAYATLSLLRNLKFSNGKNMVRPKDIGLLGFSDGATAVASTLYDTKSTPSSWEWKQKFDGKEYNTSSGVKAPPNIPSEGGFAGGVFYYGGSGGFDFWGNNACGSNALEGNIYTPYAPILYQLPSDGYLTENSLCLVDLLKKKGKQVDLNIYENVGHGFDFEDIVQSTIARNNTINWFKKILNME
ncbi:hypothetical protein HME9304_01931 [Flagellimonas maritima]|uniref:Dienelactone hydrolase domain-containing protein n=1 Tax=Flagellimonas maritima TaxID=1383885 RepID=A0A2Z4LSP9_9FLAO|nr:hypothetical protein [Allomuricauda aurantiaca]AWX44925.1 hypothetical protein HME9304_01931 [Allomuricauda aurantiaca]